MNNSFSFPVPIKAPISFISKVIFNNFPTSYNYLHFIPSGGSTIDALPSGGTFSFLAGIKYFLDGDFLAGSPVTIKNATVFMKEGAGILAQRQFELSQTSIIKGLDGAQWKGIAFAAPGEVMSIPVLDKINLERADAMTKLVEKKLK